MEFRGASLSPVEDPEALFYVHGGRVPILDKRRRQAANARQATDARFPTLEARTEYFRAMARSGNARRCVMAGDDVAALASAYRTFETIVKKYGIDTA